MRIATVRDLPTLVDRKVRIQRLSRHALASLGDRDAVYRNFLDAINDHRMLVVGPYAVMYEVGRTFWSDKDMLFEQLVLRACGNSGQAGDPSGDVSRIPEILTSIAKALNCVAVITGDSSRRSMMTNVYTRAGFQPVGTTFMRDIV